MQFGKKTTWHTVVYSYPVLCLMLVIMVLLAMSVFERYTAEREMRERRAASEAAYAALQAREATLRADVEYLAGERGIEEELRKNFDVAKPGEQVIVLTGEPETVDVPATTTPPESSGWQFWR
jgi:cell division protein FtsB